MPQFLLRLARSLCGLPFPSCQLTLAGELQMKNRLETYPLHNFGPVHHHLREAKARDQEEMNLRKELSGCITQQDGLRR